jgi:hypothetical protein
MYLLQERVAAGSSEHGSKPLTNWTTASPFPHKGHLVTEICNHLQPAEIFGLTGNHDHHKVSLSTAEWEETILKTPQSRVFLEKLVKIFLLLWNLKVHYHPHSSPHPFIFCSSKKIFKLSSHQHLHFPNVISLQVFPSKFYKNFSFPMHTTYHAQLILNLTAI